MKQAVLRQTLGGSWTAFTFSSVSRFFYVKNFTDEDIYVSFENGTEDNKSFLIPSGAAEEVAMCWSSNNGAYFVDTIYVKGTGSVEVQAMDTTE